MSTEPPKPPVSPWQLTPARIVLLLLGLVLLAYIASAFMGGLTNYEQLKEAAQEKKLQQVAPADPAPATPTPAN